MNVTIFEPKGTKDSLTCEFCHMPIDGKEPAESLMPEIAKGKYGKLAIAHSRCAVQSAKKMYYVGRFTVISVSDSAKVPRPQH